MVTAAERETPDPERDIPNHHGPQRAGRSTEGETEMKKTTTRTLTHEYDDEGRLVKAVEVTSEVTEADDSSDAGASDDRR